jgi:hypothetical protein
MQNASGEQMPASIQDIHDSVLEQPAMRSLVERQAAWMAFQIPG